MEVEFKLEEKDLVALAKYQMEHSPAIIRRYRLQRYGLVTLFGLLAIVGLLILRKPALAAYSGAFALFCFGFYPFYYRWLIGRTLRQIVGARLNPTVFSLRKLRLSAEGLEQVTAGKKTLIPWSRIGPVTVTSDHAFIAVGGVFGQAIPRARVEEDRFLGFVQALRAGRPDEAPAGT
jgi:hypothetical protein